MDAAEDLILDRGFAATSVEGVIQRAGVTKGAFFHHFPSKQDLARALMERYVALDHKLLESTMAAAEQEHDDPLAQLLAFTAAYRDLFAGLVEPFRGCLMASYISESGLIDEDTLGLVEQSMRAWRDRIGAKLDEIVELHPPAEPVDLDALADAVLVVVEGAFIVSRTLDEADLVAAQIELHRRTLQALFAA